MDIAEIRKKAKKQAGSPAPATATAVPVHARDVPAAPVPPAAGAVVAPDVSVPAERADIQAASLATAGIDRLFASRDEGRFASEEVYQTALASRDLREEAGFTQFLAFQLGPEEYALDITQISEIIKPREYTDIPRVPEFVLGLISLRGVVVPVFDLRHRFRLGKAELSSSSRIVVCREDDVTAGLLVDSINQVIRLAADKIEPPPAVLTGIDRHLVDGVGRFQGRMIILLNLANVLAADMA